jgi:PAS domain S-box-containing protein
VDGLSRKVAEELESLRELSRRNAELTDAHEALLIHCEFVKDSLHEREASFRELISAVPAGVYACDTDGFIVYCNRQAIELWGREPELHGSPWSFLDSLTVSRGDGTIRATGEMLARQVISTGMPVLNQELLLERPDHSRIHVLANVAPLRDAKGAIHGAVNIFQDITERKLHEKECERLLHELERSNGELSQFSYAVSHDLQTPVRTIRLLTQLLVKGQGDPPAEPGHLAGMICQAADGMERLIQSLLGYAQVGQGELNRRPISVEAVIEAVRVTLSDAIAGAKAHIVCKGLPEADADPVQMYQLFENLIANAIKYHQPGTPPVIEIEGEAFGDGWRFTVTDNGQGIPREHQEMIFEPLKRLHGSDTPGTGLGLAICRAITIRHGGRIWVESKGAGQGARFRFTLSRTSERSKAAGGERGRGSVSQPDGRRIPIGIDSSG